MNKTNGILEYIGCLLMVGFPFVLAGIFFITESLYNSKIAGLVTMSTIFFSVSYGMQHKRNKGIRRLLKAFLSALVIDFIFFGIPYIFQKYIGFKFAENYLLIITIIVFVLFIVGSIAAYRDSRIRSYGRDYGDY